VSGTAFNLSWQDQERGAAAAALLLPNTVEALDCPEVFMELHYRSTPKYNVHRSNTAAQIPDHRFHLQIAPRRGNGSVLGHLETADNRTCRYPTGT
jgi:hypothetical protein